MRKKYLSALLFGALLFASAGTFTSCKDYDDDIDNLQSQISANASAIEALKKVVESGDYVTGVEKSATGLTITFKNAGAKTITLEDKVGSIVTVENGVLCIDGKATEIKVAEPTEPTEHPKDQIIIENGMWSVLQEDGTYKSTGIPVSGVTVAGSEADGFKLTIYDENGVPQTIELPTAASAISGLDILGYVANGNIQAASTNVKYNYTWVGTTLSDDLKNWNKEEGVRKVAAKQVLSTLNAANSSLLFRIAPADLDASTFSFTLVNSKMGEAPIALGTPKAYDGLLVRAAVSGNGLWTVPTTAIDNKTYNADADYKKEFESGTNKIAFALKEKHGFVSNYDLTFTHDGTMSKNAEVAKVNGTTVVGKKNVARDNNTLQNLNPSLVNKVAVGKVEITFDNPIYDAHLHIDDATIQRWNITDIEGTSFKVGKRPDDITSANFQVRVHYVTIKGEVKSEYIPFSVAKSFAGVTALANTDHTINAKAADDKFTLSLDPMFADLDTNTALWKSDVKSADVQLYQVGTNADGSDKAIATPTGVNIHVLNKDGGNVTSTGTSAAAKVQINLAQKWPGTGADYALDKEYYAVVSFTDGTDILNKVKVPFTLNIPDISSIFVPQDGVFVNGVAYAYMDAKANVGGSTVDPAYNLASAFNDLKTKLGASTFTIGLEKSTKIVGDYTSDGLAKAPTTDVTNANVENATIQLKPVEAAANNTPKGYGQELIVNITKAKYLNIYYYSADDATVDYSFKMKIMSPLLEGKITAVNNEVVVDATKIEGSEVNGTMITGYTYNNIEYSIFKDQATTGGANPWKRKEIKSVSFASADTNVFTCDQYGSNYTPADNTTTPATPAKDGSIKVYPKNLAATTSSTLKVTLTDAWGYTLTQDIKITVKVQN